MHCLLEFELLGVRVKVTAALNCHRIILLIRSYDLLIRNYGLLTRNYEWLIRNYELVITNW